MSSFLTAIEEVVREHTISFLMRASFSSAVNARRARGSSFLIFLIDGSSTSRFTLLSLESIIVEKTPLLSS